MSNHSWQVFTSLRGDLQHGSINTKQTFAVNRRRETLCSRCETDTFARATVVVPEYLLQELTTRCVIALNEKWQENPRVSRKQGKPKTTTVPQRCRLVSIFFKGKASKTH